MERQNHNPSEGQLQPMYDDCQVFDPATFGNTELDKITDICGIVSDSVTTVADAVKHIADVKYEIEKLDHQLDAFIAQTNANLERFKTAMPILDRQLTNISARIDTITNNIIANTQQDTLTEDGVKKHQFLIDLLSKTNDSFNNMLVKILGL